MRALIVEDEVSLAGAVADGLVQAGFGVDVAHDGTEGLWRAREFDYDVILLDIMIPGPSGYDVLRALRAEGVWSPVLMLTAKDGEYDEADAMDLGADDYLIKPFSFVVLLAHLRALVRRGRPARPAVLTCGSLQFDPATRRCSRGGTGIALTSREASVVEYLMFRRGQVVSKADILAHVWDENFAGDPNVVEVYVLRLRRKIDAPFGCGSLQTVRGSGYRLWDPDSDPG